MTPRFEDLSDYQRDCLRRVYQHQTSKEIARHYGVSRYAIDQALERAARTLAVTSRRDAARLLHEHEGASERVGYEPRDVAFGPASVADPVSPAVVVDEGGEGSGSVAAQPPFNPAAAIGWPLRRRGERDNLLPIAARAAWLVILPVMLAVGFGALSNGLKVLADTVLAIVATT